MKIISYHSYSKTNLHQLDYFQDNQTPSLLISPNLCQVQKQQPGRSNSRQLQGYGQLKSKPL